MMDELSQLNFEQDFKEVLSLADAERWKVEKIGPLDAMVSVVSQKAPEEIFFARLIWNVYPGEPPSLKFRDGSKGSYNVATAWPEVRGFRPTSLDACVNYCIEGFMLHPEWRNDPEKKWNPLGNALLRVIKTLQNELDDYFIKRYKP